MTPEPDTTASKPLLGRRGWAFVFAVWVVLGLLEASKAYVMSRLGGQPVGVGRVLVGNLPWWLLWGVLTPAIFAVARRWPIRGNGIWTALAVHLPASVLFATTHLTATAWIWINTAAPNSQGLLWILVNWANTFLFLELFTYGTVVAAYHALVHYRLFREREREAHRLEVAQVRLEREITRARLQALQLELQPHFLFNTFNAITGLVRRNENEAAVEMLVRLGELLRLTLDRDGSAEVALDDEIEVVDCYLGIQRVRFPGLDFVVDVPPSLRRALVPTLVLQPLVENAVRHGLAGSGEGSIAVRAREEEGRLMIEVVDSGNGVAEREAEAGPGVGLRNTRSRLHQLWGSEAEVRLENASPSGTRAVLRFPLRLAEELA
jgi:sensor histidine kinase YesM